jgi:hypothetical protein
MHHFTFHSKNVTKSTCAYRTALFLWTIPRNRLTVRGYSDSSQMPFYLIVFRNVKLYFLLQISALGEAVPRFCLYVTSWNVTCYQTMWLSSVVDTASFSLILSKVTNSSPNVKTVGLLLVLWTLTTVMALRAVMHPYHPNLHHGALQLVVSH